MMTQPIRTFQNLTSETAGGNADTGYAVGFAHADRAGSSARPASPAPCS